MQSWNFKSFDGVHIAVHEMGEGRPLILLHGLFSNAETNWIKFGHAQTLSDAGFRVIMPDFRAHGESDQPEEATAYPNDVLVQDIQALIDHIQLTDYDICGYSLGARTLGKLLAAGISPRKAILSGMGFEGLTGWEKRQAYFQNILAEIDTVQRGDEHFMAVQFLKQSGANPVAVSHLIKTFVNMPVKQVAAIQTDIMVLCGAEDQDNGSSVKLAECLPNAIHVEIPGNHMSCVTKPDLSLEMVRFLTAS